MKSDEMKAGFQKLTMALKQHLPEKEIQYLSSLIDEGVFLNVDMLENEFSREHGTSADPTQMPSDNVLDIDEIEILQEELFCGDKALNITIQLALENIIRKSGQKPEVISICKQIQSLAAESIARLDELLKQSREDKQQLPSKPKP
jgi:hypothetical protein